MSYVMCESYAVRTVYDSHITYDMRFKCFNVNFRLFKDYVCAFVGVLHKLHCRYCCFDRVCHG